MYRGAPFSGGVAGPTAVPLAARKSAEQPSETHTPLSEYPHVFPSRHAASPYERARTIPFDVSAGHSRRSPSFDAQETVVVDACVACAVVAGGPPGCWRPVSCAKLESTKTRMRI